MTPVIAELRARLRACRGVLVDSNALLDVVTNDQNWGKWSARALAEVAEHTIPIINPVVYSEISIGYPLVEILVIPGLKLHFIAGFQKCLDGGY